MAKSALFSRRQAGGMFAIEDQSKSTGDRWYVHSGTGTDGAGYGQNPDSPVATLDYAIGLCTANKGDIIYVMPGHSETYTTTGTKVTADIAGVKIVGLGNGADRPTFTFSHTGAAWTITVNGVSMENLLLVAGVDSVTAPLTISGADCTLQGLEWRDTTNIEFVRGLITTAAADRISVLNCVYNGYTGGDACVNFARLVGADVALFENCSFLGKFSTAVIEFHTTACSKVMVDACDFLVTGTTDLSKNVVDTATLSTWEVKECFDLAAGARFSGGSGAALASDDVSSVITALGAQADTAVQASGTATAQAYLKGILDVLSGTTGISTFPAAAAAANGVSIAEVIRYIQASQIGTLTNTGGTATLGGIIGDVANSDVATRLTNILTAVGKSAAFAWGACDAGMAGSTTTIVDVGLAGYGNDFFNGHYYIQILLNANSATNAPEDEIRAITDYVSATGTFTTNAFSANVEENDLILVLHETAVFIGEDNSNNIAATTNVAVNKDGSILERLEDITQELSGASGVAAFPAGAAAANAVSLAEVLRYTQENVINAGTVLPGSCSLYDVLAGANGIPTFPAGAAAANAVSMAEVLRYIQENIIVGTGTVLPGNQSIYDLLAGANGIATFPAAAAPANGISIAEVLRDVWDVVRNGTGGTEPGTNRSVVDEIRGAAMNYNGVNYLAVSVDLSNATWNTVASHEVFTVTGAVRMRMLLECTADLASAGAPTIQFGLEGATNAFIAATTGLDIDVGDLWDDATPTAGYDTFANAVFDRVIVGGLDVGYEVAVAAFTGGTLVFHCWWEGLNATGAVAAGAGGAL